MLYALDGLETRPTTDVDFLAERISRDRDSLTDVFKEIVAINCNEDGVIFDAENIKTEPITVEKKYPGLRFYLSAKLDTITHNMSIDIGFGDIVSPHPITIDFPLLLSDIPSINIQAYSLETIIAEKFHTMIDRDRTNSRMKDYFDCYQLLTHHIIDDNSLYEAIKTTFKNRGLEYNPNLKLFTNEFIDDKERLNRWSIFLKKIQWKEDIPFAVVMKVIKERLQPMAIKYWEIEDSHSTY